MHGPCGAMMNRQVSRVLLIDASPQADEIEQTLCQSSRGAFEVLRAARVDEALLRLRESAVDVVLASLELPDGRGLPVLKELLKSALPVLVLSDEHSSLNTQALHEGAQACLIRSEVTRPLL